MNPFEKFPAELRAQNRFHLWKYEIRDGKRAKVPHGINLQHCDHTNPVSWVSFAKAYEVLEKHPEFGLGIAADGSDTFIDIDNCVSNGIIEPWVLELQHRLPPTYGEFSPSGTGLHLYFWGALDLPGKKKNGVEIYFREKYFTVTGQQIPGTPDTVATLDPDTLKKLWDDVSENRLRPYLQKSGSEKSSSPLIAVTPLSQTDREARLARALADDLSDYGGDRSAAVYAVLQFLARKHQGDEAAMVKEFEGSKLHSSWEGKWKRLQDNELAKAIANWEKNGRPRWDCDPVTAPPMSDIERDWAIREAFAATEKDRREAAAVGESLHETDSRFDFIKNYVFCNDRYESPTELHEVIAIALLAAIANQNHITFEYSARPTSLDLWIAAVLASGSGKNESTVPARQMAENFLTFANTGWGSPEYFFEALATAGDRSQFWVFTEAAGLLARLNEPRWAGVKAFLTDLYDSPNTPATIKHRTNKKGEANVPDIVFTAAPRTNILLMSNSDWYVESLQQSDATGGFLARFIPVWLPDSKRLVHYVPEPSSELWTLLVAKLARISQVTGQADLSEVYSPDPDCLYARWYRETADRWREKGAFSGVFFKRWRVFVLKLAVIFELSRSESLKVSKASFDRAAAWLRKLEAVTFKLTEDGFSPDALRLHRKENFFKAAGAAGVTLAKYTTRFRGERPSSRRKDDLAALLEMQSIFKVKAETIDGKYFPERFVHLNFLEQSK
jgi:hypothetical protein